MNKYQEALNRLNQDERYQQGDEKLTLQELVDRATPMKAIHIPGIASGEDINRWKCPNMKCCHKTRRNIREPKIGWCDRCGQATDYTEEE